MPSPYRRLRRFVKSLVERAVLFCTRPWVRDRHPLDAGLSRIESLRRWARLGTPGSAKDMKQLEEMHRRFWSDAGNARWHATHEERLEEWFLREHQPFFFVLEELVQGRPSALRVVELGTGDGKVLAYLAGLLAPVSSFTGVDLNQAQVRLNRERYGAGGLHFVSGDMVDYVERHGEPHTLYVTNGGVLEYLSQGGVEALVRSVADRPPAVLALVEPLADDMDLGRDRTSRPFGYERSISHNYPAILAEAGFVVRHRRENRVGGVRWLEIIAETPA